MKLNLLLAVAAMATVSTAALAETSRLERIKETATITVGNRETAAPLSFMSIAGDVQGYSVDICKEVVKDLATRLSVPNLQVRYVTVTPQTRIPLMASGTVDIECGNTAKTLSRLGQVGFSMPIFVDATRVAVPHDAKDVTSLSDLAGKSVGVSQGALVEKVLRQRLEDEKIPDLKLTLLPNEGEGLMAVGTGRIDAFISNTSVIAAELAKSRYKDQLRVTGENLQLQLGQVSIMLPRGDTDLELAVNTTLARLFRSGEMDKLFDKWFSPVGIKKDPINQAAFELGALAD
jgi:glutamate/aspartate transport system substrate-binding protein